MEQQEENKEKVVATIDLTSFAQKPKDTKEIIQLFKDNILSGDINALEGFTVIKRMHKVAEEVLKDEKVKDAALKEYNKYSGETKTGSLVKYGATILNTSVYTWYDCTGCGHPVLDALYAIDKEVKARIKLLEEELKLMIPKDEYKAGATPGLGIPNTDKNVLIEAIPKLEWIDGGGEVATIKRPKKMQTMGLKYMKL